MNKNIFTVIDFETTGLNYKKDQIIEIGAVKYDISDRHKEIGSFHTMVKLEEGRDLPPFITNLTGIKKEDLVNGMNEQEALRMLVNFIGDSIVVGQNVSFDLGFLSRYKGDNVAFDFCDTRAMSYMVDPNEPASLKDLCKRYEVNLNGQHRALNDVRATWQVFIELWMELKLELDNFMNTLVTDSRGLTYIPPNTKRMYRKVCRLELLNDDEVAEMKRGVS